MEATPRRAAPAKFLLAVVFLAGAITQRGGATQGTALPRVTGAATVARRIAARLDANPNDAAAAPELHMLLAAPNDLTRDESMRLRQVVRRHSRAARETLVAEGEPGTKVVISGTVTDGSGSPVAGAEIEVFQTDAKGLYSLRDAETKKMDEPNSRIFGFLKTGADGRYEFRTVRPGGYPYPLPGQRGDRSWVPQHIHMIVTAPGFERFTCGGSTCQLVFADDPRMTSYWQDWARRMRFPVLTLRRDSAGVFAATYDISLSRPGT